MIEKLEKFAFVIFLVVAILHVAAIATLTVLSVFSIHPLTAEASLKISSYYLVALIVLVGGLATVLLGYLLVREIKQLIGKGRP